MTVIERAGPRTIHNISTNHGGVVVVVYGNARLQLVNTGGCRATFEHVSCRITSRQSSCVVLRVYRHRSDHICNTFFGELSDVLRLTVVPVIVTGDNIHLECHDDTHSRRFTELLAWYGLQSRVQTATHDRGGWLDVVATRSDLASPIVEVHAGFSDHRLLQGTSTLDRPSPVY